MFKQIDFTKEKGYPLTQKTLLFMQSSYNDVLSAVSRVFGDYNIISGVTHIGGNVYSNGWVVMDGEILPFSGGTVADVNTATVIIEEAVSARTFQDGSINNVLFSRLAKFGEDGVLFTDFLRVNFDSLKDDIDDARAIAVDALSIASGNTNPIPAGVIVMWSGSVNSIPSGWALCDGTSGTPNLKGRFIIGYSATTGNYTMGATGGDYSVALTTPQLPSHTHTMQTNGNHQHYMTEVSRGDEGSSGSDDSVGSWNEGGAQKQTSFAGNHTHTINATGSNQAHENRPPYYTLAYIIKL